MTDNPFFETWETPFGIPPFDRIRPEHFPPALDRGIAEQRAEIAAIAGAPWPPSFADTIEAIERSGHLLDRVSRVFSNLDASDTNPALEEVARVYAPKLAQHQMRIALDAGLFARIADPIRAARHLGSPTTSGASSSAITCASSATARCSARPSRRAWPRSASGWRPCTPCSARMCCVTSASGAWRWTRPISTASPVLSAPAAAQAADERGLGGQYVVTLARSSIEPFLTFSARRDLRRAAHEAWTARGTHPGAADNTPLIREIMALRTEQARLLGYRDFTAYRLDNSMAKTDTAVEQLLLEVWEPAKAKAREERAALEAAARAEGLNEPLEPWDWRYYAEKVRQAQYDLDEAEVKPYFVLDNMVRAAFDTAGRLFGLSFAPRFDLPVYHPDVRVWEVRDRAGVHLGLFLHDNFARPGKHSGAWSSRYRDQQNLDGWVAPIVVNNNNFAKGDPTLLSFDDAETLFHEFGHGLHALLSRVRYPSQSGTAVRRDFVEFPSQIFEHWMAAPETLRQYARHYETGEPIPEALLQRLLSARNFNQGFATVEYTASALIDLELHRDPAPEAVDPNQFEREFLERYEVPREIGLRHRPAHFQHLFAGGGYAAGYYAYLWAEVLDADGFAAFAETGNVFDPGLAARLEDIYSAGDTRDPMELYRAFRGRDPEIGPLLRHRGLRQGG